MVSAIRNIKAFEGSLSECPPIRKGIRYQKGDHEMSYPVIDPVATGDRINALRKEMGFSVSYLKEYFGFATTNDIYKWLHGESLPSLDNMVAMSVLFGVSMNDIVIYH